MQSSIIIDIVQNALIVYEGVCNNREDFFMDQLLLCDTPIGQLTLAQRDDCIAQLSFCALPGAVAQTPLLLRAQQQLQEYFAGHRQSFDLPFLLQGTPFQKAVWLELQTIPYGQTASYGDLAKRVGRPKACRAVGGANNKNPLPIFFACHRVVGANGVLVGYAGGLDSKRFLLNLEKEHCHD